jgi:hypothetical protein
MAVELQFAFDKFNRNIDCGEVCYVSTALLQAAIGVFGFRPSEQR